MCPNQEPDSDDFVALQNKGALWVLMALGQSEGGLTFKQIKERTSLTQGTTQRRLDELEEHGWICKEPAHNESGQPVNIYNLSEQSKEVIDGFKEMGRSLLDALTNSDSS